MPKNSLPEIVRKREKLIQKINGTPVAVIELCRFELLGEDRVTKRLNSFFCDLTEGFKKWVDNDFSIYSADAFAKDENPRKRFRYAPLVLKYSLDAEICESYTLSFKTEICLQKNGSVLAERIIYGRYSLKNGRLQKIPRILKKHNPA